MTIVYKIFFILISHYCVPTLVYILLITCVVFITCYNMSESVILYLYMYINDMYGLLDNIYTCISMICMVY